MEAHDTNYSPPTPSPKTANLKLTYIIMQFYIQNQA